MDQFEGIPDFICRCGAGNVIKRISQSQKNPGRSYLKCPNSKWDPKSRSFQGGCGYYKFLDDLRRQTKSEIGSSRIDDSASIGASPKIRCVSCAQLEAMIESLEKHYAEQKDQWEKWLSNQRVEIVFLRGLLLVLVFVFFATMYGR